MSQSPNEQPQVTRIDVYQIVDWYNTETNAYNLARSMLDLEIEVEPEPHDPRVVAERDRKI